MNAQDKKMKYNKLTNQEEQIILFKGTERPFTGEYYNNKEKGTYVCKRCDAPLYRSDDKFDSGCGWPSFDAETPGAVKHQLDADGIRTEILCAYCGAHLGHVFIGEGFTDKNVRHCVNSISMNFIPAKTNSDQKPQTAYFAGGCFWGVEYYFKNVNGVISTAVGYMGGHTDNPTYEQVCSGKTGHVETIEVVFDSERTSYEKLAKLFFEIHDPTQVNRQGPDIGEQYQSVIFYANSAQKQVAENLIKILKGKGYKLATKLKMVEKFWTAEGFHQDYYRKTGKQPYCHKRVKLF